MFARIIDNIVQEVIDFDPAGHFHPSITWTAVPEGTLPGAARNPDGTVTNPVVVAPAMPPAPPVQPTSQTITTGEFLTRFTLPELVAVRASADPGVTAWLWVLGHLVTIDVGDPKTIAAVGYLVEAGLLTPSRAASVLGG